MWGIRLRELIHCLITSELSKSYLPFLLIFRNLQDSHFPTWYPQYLKVNIWEWEHNQGYGTCISLCQIKIVPSQLYFNEYSQLCQNNLYTLSLYWKSLNIWAFPIITCDINPALIICNSLWFLQETSLHSFKAFHQPFHLLWTYSWTAFKSPETAAIMTSGEIIPSLYSDECL